MLIRSSICMALLLLPVVARGQQPVPSCGAGARAVISDSGLGFLRLGQSVEAVRRACRVLADTTIPNYDFAEPERVLLVAFGPDTVRAALGLHDRIDRIDINTPRLHTRDGVRVGARLRTFLRPGATGGVSEATIGLTLRSHCGLRLVISGAPDSLETGDELDYDQLRRFPSLAQVSSIQIWGCE